jgi:uncharacterized protein YndB with AHSA1/START domain
MEPETLHDTLVFEQIVCASPDRVFSAYSDLSTRIEWGSPSANSRIIYDQSDFQEGGSDHYRCGPGTNPNIHCTTTYLEITENRRIVSSETITVDGKPMSASLTTVQLIPAAEGTRLRVTTQIASFVGEVMLQGHEKGTSASLANLARYFAPS